MYKKKTLSRSSKCLKSHSELEDQSLFHTGVIFSRAPALLSYGSFSADEDGGMRWMRREDRREERRREENREA